MAHAFYVTTATGIDITQKHQDNIAASLAHRLEVARAKQNFALVAQLEQERRQLERPALASLSHHSLWQVCQQAWSDLRQAIAHSMQLSVERRVTDTGEVWWQAHDPKTGKVLYTDSEADVVQWIEENGLGR